MENHYEEIISPIISKLNEINKMRVNKERKIEMAKELKNELISNMKELEFINYPKLFQKEDIVAIVNSAFDKDEESTILSDIIDLLENRKNHAVFYHITQSIIDIILQKNDIENLEKFINIIHCSEEYFRKSDNLPNFATHLCNNEVTIENQLIIEVCVHWIIQNNEIEKLESMIEYHTFLGKNAKNGEKNIMHYICNLSNYPAFVKFFDLYPDLMSKTDRNGKFPISCLGEKLSSKKQEKNNMIISHYLSSGEPIEWNILKDLTSYLLTNNNIFLLVERIINDKEKLGWILYRLIEYISSEILEYFLKIGVDPNYIDPRYKKSLLHNVCHRCQNDDFFYILEEAGAIIDHVTLSYFCYMDNLKLVKYIREKYNMDINQVTIYNNNMPIIYYLALANDNEKRSDATNVFMYLLNDLNVDVTSTYVDGMSLLHMIYDNKTHYDDRVTIMKKIIERGVDPYATDKNNRCFFHLSDEITDVRDADALGINLSVGSDNMNNLKFMIILPVLKIKRYLYSPDNNKDDIMDLCRIIYKKHFACRELEVNNIINDFLEVMLPIHPSKIHIYYDLLVVLTEFGIEFSETVKDFLHM